MSGPKTYSYTLTDRIFEDHQRLRQENELDGLRWHAGELQRSLKDAGVQYSPPDGDDAQSLRKWIESTRQQLKIARERGRARASQSGLASVLDALGSASGKIETTQDEAPATQTTPASVTKSTDATELSALRIQARRKVEEFKNEYPVPLTEKLVKSLEKMADMEDLSMAKVLGRQIKAQLAESRAEMQAEQSEAKALLGKLPADGTPGLEGYGKYVSEVRMQLGEVTAGKARLDSSVCNSVQTLLGRAEQQRAKIAAEVIETALEDLGYTVEPVSETLFVDGGNVHFRTGDQPDDYYVRLQVDPRGDRMVFKVVRADDNAEAQADEKTDEVVENNWCAAAPQVVQALKNRGIDAGQVAHTSAGAAPVDIVDADSLDKEFWESNRRSKKRPRIFEEPKAKRVE